MLPTTEKTEGLHQTSQAIVDKIKTLHYRNRDLLVNYSMEIIHGIKKRQSLSSHITVWFTFVFNTKKIKVQNKEELN